MLAKYWKKIGLIIVIVACVFNVMIKLINKLSFDKEMITSAQYIQEQNAENNKNSEEKQK
ncbi:MAG: hypothetical protein IKF38_02215 [Clostridia bacterium]|nr:hypothetical protein [Clostridia bacterium]